MKAFLTDKGFTDIKQVLEKEATTDGIKTALEWLVTDTQPGDVIVFHYSGHGSQLPSHNEPDGFEEIICPVDLNWLDKVITDETLRTVFNKAPNGVNATVILDCCHSGTMLNQTESLTTKDLAPPTATKKVKGARFMKPPAKIAKKLVDKQLVDWQASKDVNATALLIAGCKASQTSADTVVDGQPQGAATAALLKSAKADPQISYKKLVNDMTDFMTANKYTQVPELDGSSSLYDQIFIEPFSFTIPLGDVIPTEMSGEDPVAAPASENSSNKTLLIAATVVALIVLILILG
jgi:hypothetical protein